MWTARCDHVRQLHPPLQYAAAMEDFYQATLLHPVKGNTTFACMQPLTWRGSHTGRGRFAAERWLFSHPLVQPCAAKQRNSKANDNNNNENDNFGLVKEPNHKARVTKLGTNPKFESTFARLEGRIFEWQYLYNGTQLPDNSWMHRYYGHRYRTGTAAFKEACRAGAVPTNGHAADDEDDDATRE